MKNFKLLTLIETVLGRGRSTNKGNVAFHCPFCHHNKKKLEVNIISHIGIVGFVMLQVEK